MKERTNIRLDEQARQDAEYLMKRHNIGSVSAAVRFALRELVRKYEQEINPQNLTVRKEH